MSDRDFNRHFPMPDPDDFEAPDTPAEICPGELWAATRHGYAKAALIGEMLSMGHVMEAGRLIVGEDFFSDQLGTVDAAHRASQDDE